MDAATTNPETRDLLAHLDQEGVEVTVKLATSDLGMANLYVVGYDRNLEDAPHPLALSACGEAAHPNREIALRKSLLEYVAARARKLFNHAPLAAIESIAPPGYLDRFRESPLGSALVVSGDAGSRPAARYILLTPEMEREMGPAWLDDEAVERTVANFYPLYREPGRHVAALAAEEGGNC